MVLTVSILQACTWVQLTPEGEKVRILNANEVSKCEYLGQTTSSTAASVAGINRHPNAVRDELESLARNSAINLDGDTIVADGEISEGKLNFKVYRCVPR